MYYYLVLVDLYFITVILIIIDIELMFFVFEIKIMYHMVINLDELLNDLKFA